MHSLREMTCLSQVWAGMSLWINIYFYNWKTETELLICSYSFISFVLKWSMQIISKIPVSSQIFARFDPYLQYLQSNIKFEQKVIIRFIVSPIQ